MKKGKLLFGCVVLSVMLFASLQVAFASDSWTDAATYELDGSVDQYTTITTTGTKLGQNKTTNSTEFQVYTVARSMLTFPQFKLVNSNNETRSDSVATAAEGHYATGGGNTGTIGYALYGAVKPNLLQTGVDTIKLQMKVF